VEQAFEFIPSSLIFIHTACFSGTDGRDPGAGLVVGRVQNCTPSRGGHDGGDLDACLIPDSLGNLYNTTYAGHAGSYATANAGVARN
jgi:hypothetical protein